MTFTIQSNDTAQDPATQSEMYTTDLAILIAGINGVGVVSGCAVTAQGSPDMTVAVAAGVVKNADGTVATVSAGNLTVGTADGSHPRIDLISASAAGVKTITAGSAAASPKPADLPSGHIGLAMVLVGTSDTAIQNAEITSKRIIVTPAMSYLEQIMTGDVTQTNANQFYDANNTLTIPAGTWLIFYKLTLKPTVTSATHEFHAQLLQGSTVIDEAQFTVNAAGVLSIPATLCGWAPFVAGSSTVIKMQGADIRAGTIQVRDSVDNTGSSATMSRITAIKLA